MIDPTIDRLLCKLIKTEHKQTILDIIHGEIEHRQMEAELRVKDAYLKASNVESYVECK